MVWESETFAYAEDYDEKSGRYTGLQYGQALGISADTKALLVTPEAARLQIDLAGEDDQGDDTCEGSEDTNDDTTPVVIPKPLTRYHGTKTLNTQRVGLDASTIAEELISHIAGQAGATVKVTMEIEAYMPDGATEHLVRTVTENGNSLELENHGFEAE